MNAVDDTADTGTLKEALVDENDSILQRVTLFKMSELLSYVPEHLVWDTYKVDAQGNDPEIILSTGEYIKNFKCVMAEFADKDISKDPKFRAYAFLRE
eukprot:UN23060